MSYTRKEIKKDPWGARSSAAEKIRELADKIEDMYISESVMMYGECPEEAAKVVSNIKGILDAAGKFVEKVEYKLDTMEGGG